MKNWFTSNPYICIVEDDNFYATALKKSLSNENYKKLSVFNSAESFLDEHTLKPDVILLDHHMDRISGLDLLRDYKRINPSTEVILLTGQKDWQVAKQSFQLGVVDYVEKNAGSFSYINNCISQLIKTKRSDYLGLLKEQLSFYGSIVVIFLMLTIFSWQLSQIF